MMYIQCFLMASLLSFAGSLQVGPVNVAVAYTTIHKNIQAAFLLAVGGSLPEAFYAALAIRGADMIAQIPQVLQLLRWIFIPLLILMGFHFLWKKHKTGLVPEKYQLHASFLKGLLLGFFNPMLFTFWVSVLLLLKRYHLFDDEGWLMPLSFMVGTSFGALVLLGLVACFFHQTRRNMALSTLAALDRVTGIIFLGLALMQILYNPT